MMKGYWRLAALGILASFMQHVSPSPVQPGGRLHSKKTLTAAFNGAPYDFPDPSIEQVSLFSSSCSRLRNTATDVDEQAWPSDGGKWYAFATTGNGYNIQVAVANSPSGPWTALAHDALPNSGSWTTGSANWAPDVKRLPPESKHTYIMTYSGALKDNPTHHCVGIATSDKIEGPYTPRGSPAICPDIPSTGGAIDSSSFYDAVNNKRYIVYKE